MDSLVSHREECIQPGDSFSSYWVATYRVLSVEPRPGTPDTVDAVVEIVSAARQEPSANGPYGSIVTQGVTRDTLRYVLVPDRRLERWVVCGEERGEGFTLGSYGRADNVAFRLPGTSERTVRALIDSLQAAARQ